MWRLFEISAVAIAQLYRDRQQFSPAMSWQSFQESARSVTALYQDSVELHRKALELGVQLGHRKRTKELVAWAKRRRRNVKRDDLLAALDSRTTPVPVGPRLDLEPIHLPSVEDPGLFGISESLTGTSLTSLPEPTPSSQPTPCPAHCAAVGPVSSPGVHSRRRMFVSSEGGSSIRDLSYEAAFAHALLTGRKRLASNDASMDASPKRGKFA